MEVVDALPEHVDFFLSQPIRQDDLDEWFAGSRGRPVAQILREALAPTSGVTCRALLNEDGQCICLWGVAPGTFEEGVVWLIASVEAEARGKAIHRLWPKEIALMHERYRLLVAFAYGNNALHLSWLETIGFKPVAADYIGPAQLPFITYFRGMPCVTQ